MNQRLKVMLLMSAVMGAQAFGHSAPTTTAENGNGRNAYKKCFNPECSNRRTDNKLYCSADCCKKHRESFKNKK